MSELVCKLYNKFMLNVYVYEPVSGIEVFLGNTNNKTQN